MNQANLLSEPFSKYQVIFLLVKQDMGIVKCGQLSWGSKEQLRTLSYTNGFIFNEWQLFLQSTYAGANE